MGLMAVSGLSRHTLESLLAARRAGGPFTSLADFSSRVGPVSSSWSLLRGGAFDGFELTRPELLWRLEYLFHRGRRKEPPGQGANRSLFGSDSGLDEERRVIPRLPEYSRRTRLQLERELFGFTVSAHPLALHEEELRLVGALVDSTALAAHAGRRVRLAGRPIARKRIMTRHGAMLFLSLDDLHGTFEAVLFPDCYRRCGATALGAGPFVVGGRVQEEFGVCTLVCDELEELERAAAGRATLDTSLTARAGCSGGREETF